MLGPVRLDDQLDLTTNVCMVREDENDSLTLPGH